MYKLALPFRYLLKKRITYLAVLAVMLCVFIVLVVMTVINGLVIDSRAKNHAFVGDCIISTESLVGFVYYADFIEELKKQDFVLEASPVIKSFAVITYFGSNIAVEMMGIDAKRHSNVTGFGKTLHYHRQNPESAFETTYNPELDGFVGGIDLMLKRGPLGEYNRDGYLPRIKIAVSCFPLTPAGAIAKIGLDMAVNTKNFHYSDDSRSGLARIDSNIIYLPFDQAQTLCGMAGKLKRANAIFVKFTPGTNIDSATQKIASLWTKFADSQKDQKQANLLKNVSVQSWKTHQREAVAPMEKEQIMLTFSFIMIGLITVFIIFVVFYMIINHSSKDIGILKSVGASSLDVIKVYLRFALLVAVSGAAIGSVCAYLFLRKVNALEDWLFDHFGWQLWDRTIYVIGDIPDRIQWPVLGVIIASAVLACLIGALLPSYKGAKSKCVDVLRVDRL